MAVNLYETKKNGLYVLHMELKGQWRKLTGKDVYMDYDGELASRFEAYAWNWEKWEEPPGVESGFPPVGTRKIATWTNARGTEVRDSPGNAQTYVFLGYPLNGGGWPRNEAGTRRVLLPAVRVG